MTALTVVMLSGGAAFAQSSTTGTTQNQGSGAGTMTAPAGTTEKTPGSAANSTMSGKAPTALGSTEWSADRLIGADVTNNNDENVGEIEDVVLNESGQVKYVVVSVGGFLGMGDKHVAMNWSDVKANRAENTVSVNQTKDQLKQAPEYKREERPTAAPKQ
ncbi:hypothetical protein AUP43_13050 [Oceanibaculum pacificum]|uniref:PRC-barrel domain-containing protein n=2 Tax=Oceanibaculum pacificum TaxID=580166 RepID=A0A154VQ00_9PROT|nr:hypothetical protein AUP43_13050 [Oceanibaculum pacificum]